MAISYSVVPDAAGRLIISTIYSGDDYVDFGTPGHPAGTGCPGMTVDGAAVAGTTCVSPDTGAGYTFGNKATSGGGPTGILYPGATVHLHYGDTPTGPQDFTFVYWPALDLGPHPIFAPPAPSYLPNAGNGFPYSFQLIASGGGPTPPGYSFTLLAGSLPPGLTLNMTTGVISGTSTTLGDYEFYVQLSDTLPSTPVSAFFHITVSTYPGLQLGPAPIGGMPPTVIPDATKDQPYTFALTATGGGPVPPVYHFAITSGGLPAGLTLNTATGAISGAATGTDGLGTFDFTVKLTDALPSPFVSLQFRITTHGVPTMTPTSGVGGGGTAITFTNN